VKALSASRRGFTLIEVLVALAIVAIGMTALMSALTSSASTTVYMRDKTLAEWVALNQIEAVRLATQRPTKGETDGDAEMGGRKWKWHQEVMETDVKGIMRIDVSVKPAEVSGDTNWYTTLSAITGDALALPQGAIDFYARPPPAGQNGQNGQPGSPRPGVPGTTVPPVMPVTPNTPVAPSTSTPMPAPPIGGQTLLN
jgi:general secretion pathway protein I